MRTESKVGVDCALVPMLVGTCWRVDGVYACREMKVDENHPNCVGGLYWPNYPQQ
jgi:hypothetical protein